MVQETESTHPAPHPLHTLVLPVQIWCPKCILFFLTSDLVLLSDMSMSVEHNGVYCSLPLSWRCAPRPGLSDILSQPVIVDYHCQNFKNTHYAGSCAWNLWPSSVGHCLLCNPTAWSPRWPLTGAQHLTVLSGASDRLIRLFNLRMPTSEMPTGALWMTEMLLLGTCWSLCSMTIFVTLPLVFVGAVDRLRDHPAPPTRAAVLPGYGLLALTSMLFFLQWLWP